MHHLMLVTLALTAADTSLDARMSARSQLMDDDSFCGEGGRFGSPLSDWFVIGGRWSGHLRSDLLGEAYLTTFKQEFPNLATGYYRDDLVKKHQKALNRFWHRFGGTGPNPLSRSSYEELGYEDDAMLVDQTLFDMVLTPFIGKEICIGDDTPSDFADLDGEPVDASFIGRKWLVVVDYHN